MKPTAIAAAILFASTGFAQAELAVCKEYFAPHSGSGTKFADVENAGMLGVKLQKRHRKYLYFKETGCYDLSAFSKKLPSSIRLYLNNKSKQEKPSYVSGSFIRVMDGKLRAPEWTAGNKAVLPPITVSFRRNRASWHRASTELIRDGDPNFLEGRVINKNALAQFENFSVDNVNVSQFPSSIREMNIDKKPLVKWHALVAEPTDNSEEDLLQITEDTRVNFNQMFPNLQINPIDGKTVLVKNHLVRFTRVEYPTLSDEVFNTRKHPCVYFSYRIDGDTELPRSVSLGDLDFFVFRFKSDANC